MKLTPVLEPIPELAPYPADLLKREQELAPGRPLKVGIALSGGGIRSATLSLGVFQALAESGLLKQIDYLSTVSGGGYFGTFLGTLFCRDLSKVAPDQLKKAQASGGGTAAAVEEILTTPQSPPLQQLRENGRYLAPSGVTDSVMIIAVVARNWIAVQVVMVLFALLAFGTVSLARYGAEYLAVRWLPGPTTDAIRQSVSHVIIRDAVWVSPLAALVGCALLLAVLPAWAYWLVPNRVGREPLEALIKSLVVAVVGWAVVPLGTALGLTGSWVYLPQAVRWLAWGTVAWFAVSVLTLALQDVFRQTPRSKALPALRAFHSRWLARMLSFGGGLLLVAVIDTIGQTMVYAGTQIAWSVGGLYAAGSAAATALRPLVVKLARQDGGTSRIKLPLDTLVSVVAVLLLCVLVGAVAALPHWIALQGGTLLLAKVLGALLVLSLYTSRVWPFVNRSTLHGLYEERLRRAYPGASNPARRAEGSDRPAVTEPHPDDAFRFDEYQPHAHGGPLHLINVTVNETVGGQSQVERRDRKGMVMAVGPVGISVGRRHHARWATAQAPSLLDRVSSRVMFWRSAPDAPAFDTRFRVFPRTCRPEPLDPSQWMAISGAAFSTGLGARTSLGLSVLAGLLNVRLGYWWDSDVDPGKRANRVPPNPVQRLLGTLYGLFPVQVALLDEWLARFPGVEHPKWYLSDGGHSENMGAYELLRRELPFIVICDNEQDADYAFEGLATLVRLARVDFGAEIAFLDAVGLKARITDASLARWIGPLDALQRGPRSKDNVVDPATGAPRLGVAPEPAGLSLAHAALAEVRYGGPAGKTGWLLYIKPTLVGDEPPDVRQYHAVHPDFPHESTGDQFFEEPQWESYRRLGQHIGRKLFAKVTDGWSPRETMLAP